MNPKGFRQYQKGVTEVKPTLTRQVHMSKVRTVMHRKSGPDQYQLHDGKTTIGTVEKKVVTPEGKRGSKTSFIFTSAEGLGLPSTEKGTMKELKAAVQAVLPPAPEPAPMPTEGEQASAPASTEAPAADVDLE